MDAIRRYAAACDRPAAERFHRLGQAMVRLHWTRPLRQLAPRFLKNVEKDLKTLSDAQAAEDYATVQRIGHNLNGTGGAFGFPRITELGALMEQAAKDRRDGQDSAGNSGVGKLSEMQVQEWKLRRT